MYEPRGSLPPFQGRLLDYHLRFLLPKETRSTPFDTAEAAWIANHFESFNGLAAEDERFRFALEGAVDWRYAKDRDKNLLFGFSAAAARAFNIESISHPTAANKNKSRLGGCQGRKEDPRGTARRLPAATDEPEIAP